MANKIQIRRGLKSSLPTLSAGEPAFTTNTRELFIGTGSGNVNMGGSHWYRGTAISGTSAVTNNYSYSACPQVKLDDIYLNTSNGNIYACTTAGSGSSAKWTYQGCIKGATGSTGATGATGANGQDLQAVYSTTSTQVGTWINGKPIYRIVWTFKPSQIYNSRYYLCINWEDFTTAPQVLLSSLIINERFIIDYCGNAEQIFLGSRQELSELLNENSGIGQSDCNAYGIVEYVARS